MPGGRSVDTRKQVLIVDDEAYIRTLIRELVLSEGFNAAEAADAAQGIEIYSKNQPDLIITDMVLPDASGIEFINKVRMLSRTVPVIVITGYNGVDNAYELVSLNIFSYLKKPFTDLNSFGSAIRNAIDPKKGFLAGINGKFVKTYAEEPERFFNEIVTAKQEWESAVDFVDKIIMLVDPEMTLQRCNYALCTITGLPYIDLIGRKWYDVMKLTGFVPIAGDYHMCGGVEFFNDSTGRWMLLQAYPFYEVVSGESRSVRQVITLNDITETKLATEEIRAQREKIRAQNISLQNHKEKLEGALDQLSKLIVQVEREQSFNIRFENPNLVTCSEVMECKKYDCPCFGSQYARCWQIAGTHCGDNLQGDFAKRIGQCENCPVYIEATTNPVFRIGEHFNNMMNMLEKKNREAEEAYEKLKATQGQVLQQEKMASIGQLAAGVAHEINNPVGFIMSNMNSLRKYLQRFTEFMKKQEEIVDSLKAPGISADSAARIQEAKKTLKIDYILDDSLSLIEESLEGAERVKRIVQDLKSFSHIDEAEWKMADINAAIESTINIVWNEVKYKATLHRNYGHIPMTVCNPGQMNQVFINMLMNAAHAIEKQGEITVSTLKADGYIDISVSDTGCGIPEDKVSRIFEPFFTTKEVGKGTGLGLSIAYDIIKKHNGYISVESEVGKGSTFTVKIPVKEG